MYYNLECREKTYKVWRIAVLKLYVPKLEELDYRKSILKTPITKEYNFGYDLANEF